MSPGEAPITACPVGHTPFQSPVATFQAAWKKGERGEPPGFSTSVGLHSGRPSPFRQYFPTAFKHQQLQPQLPSQALLGSLVWGFLNIIIKKKKNTGKLCGLAKSKGKLVGAAKCLQDLAFLLLFPHEGSSLIPKLSLWGWVLWYLTSPHQTPIFIHLSMVSTSWETQ